MPPQPVDASDHGSEPWHGLEQKRYVRILPKTNDMETQQPRKRRAPVNIKQPPVAPESLVYEVLNGRPLYYRGYEDVLAGRKSPEDIMGSGALQ